MFTGLIEELGTVASRNDARFTFNANLVTTDIGLDHSIAVNGVCLTVVQFGPNWWSADVSDETLSRTTLGTLLPGDSINFERSVKASDRLGGHIVSGHVDATGTVISPAPDLWVGIPERLTAFLVEKGSVAVDGVSLTVVNDAPDSFSVAVIPRTMEATTIGRLKQGSLVNLEVDVLARYAHKALAQGPSNA